MDYNQRSKLKELLGKYIEITKIMKSSIDSSNIDIFETQVAERGKLISKIQELGSIDASDDSEIISLVKELKLLEYSIEESIRRVEQELLTKQSENKKRYSEMKKANNVSNKYKYGSLFNKQSKYIDNKK